MEIDRDEARQMYDEYLAHTCAMQNAIESLWDACKSPMTDDERVEAFSALDTALECLSNGLGSWYETLSTIQDERDSAHDALEPIARDASDLHDMLERLHEEARPALGDFHPAVYAVTCWQAGPKQSELF